MNKQALTNHQLTYFFPRLSSLSLSLSLPLSPSLLLSLKGGWKFRHWLNSFSLPAIVPFGAWFCPLLPKPSAELTVVVGKPLQVKKELTNGRLEYCPNILFTLNSLVLKSTRTRRLFVFSTHTELVIPSSSFSSLRAAAAHRGAFAGGHPGVAREVRGEAAGAARARGEALLRGGGEGGDGAGGVVRVTVRRVGVGETCWAFVHVYIYRQVCFLARSRIQ